MNISKEYLRPKFLSEIKDHYKKKMLVKIEATIRLAKADSWVQKIELRPNRKGGLKPPYQTGSVRNPILAVL